MIDFRDHIAQAFRAYKARAARAGREYKCLSKGGSVKDALSIQAKGSAVTVRIHGPMDGGMFGVDAKEIVDELDEANAKSIRLLVDSPGGLVTQGLTLYSDLRARADAGVAVRAEARGLVASAAVLPFLAADERTMGDGSMIMVHNPWAFMFLMDDADGIEEQAGATVKVLRAHTRNYRSLLAKRTSLSSAEAGKAMAEETWYTASEAVDAGYAQATNGDEDEDEDQDSEMDADAEAKAKADEMVRLRVADVFSRFA